MMSVFPNWKNHAITQRRTSTGCIPTGYEMILRAAGAKSINFPSFQDDFDLDINYGKTQFESRNHFGTVAKAIKTKYPWVEFADKEFTTGADKIAFIDEQLLSGRFVLASISKQLVGQNGWHIMPIVDATDDEYTFLNYVTPEGNCDTIPIKKSDVIRAHDQYDGGKEVAFLAKLGLPNSDESCS